jgi:hypothetical protein
MDVAEKVCNIIRYDSGYAVTWNIAGSIKTSEEQTGFYKLFKVVIAVAVNRVGFSSPCGLTYWIEPVVWWSCKPESYPAMTDCMAQKFKGQPIDRVIFTTGEEAEKFSYELEKRYMLWILKQ